LVETGSWVDVPDAFGFRFWSGVGQEHNVAAGDASREFDRQVGAKTLARQLRASREQTFPKRQAGKQLVQTAMILRVPRAFAANGFP
jgi:hypothetical protein